MRTALIVLAACLLAAGGAWAQKAVIDAVGVKGPERMDCITDGYDCYCGGDGLNLTIPDDDPEGLMLGAIPSGGGGGAIVDVILAVELYHTWAGDLRVWLLYDVECDGTPDVQGEVLCRIGLDGCPEDGCCGASADLAGLYEFDDTVGSIEDDTSSFPPGCYGPDYDSLGLDVFDGLPTGGCWYLFLADGASGDVGTVDSWQVCVMSRVSPVESSTWSHVKSLYR
jgi:hypothetical protein